MHQSRLISLGPKNARIRPAVQPLFKEKVSVIAPLLLTEMIPVPTWTAVGEEVSHVGLSAPAQMVKPMVDGMPYGPLSHPNGNKGLINLKQVALKSALAQATCPLTQVLGASVGSGRGLWVGLEVLGDLEGDAVGLDVVGGLDGDVVGFAVIGDKVGGLVT
jgi:hypothetical protein